MRGILDVLMMFLSGTMMRCSADPVFKGAVIPLMPYFDFLLYNQHYYDNTLVFHVS